MTSHCSEDFFPVLTECISCFLNSFGRHPQEEHLLPDSTTAYTCINDPVTQLLKKQNKKINT